MYFCHIQYKGIVHLEKKAKFVKQVKSDLELCFFFEEKIRFVIAPDLNKCFYKIKLPFVRT